jgi:hypothetical protein
MSDTTITALDLTDHVETGDFTIIDRGNKTYKINPANLGSFITKGTIYVSINGSDTNNGVSVSTPFKTIKRACKYVDDNYTNQYTIIVSSGQYTEQNPIVIPENTSIIGESVNNVIITPVNPTYDMFWINNACIVRNITFKDQKSPSSAISFPKYNSTSDADYNIAYSTPGYQITYPVSRPFITSNLYIKDCYSISKGFVFPLQTDVLQTSSLSLSADYTSINFTQSLYNNLTSISVNGNTNYPVVFPNVSSHVVAYQDAIDYFTYRIGRYDAFQDYYNINSTLTALGFNPLNTQGLSSSFFRDVRLILNSLVYDISANTTRLATEVARNYFYGVSSLMLPYSSFSTKNAVLSGLDKLYLGIKNDIFANTPTPYTAGTIPDFVTQEINRIKTSISSQSTVYYTTTSSVPSSFTRSAALLSSNRAFIQNEAYLYLYNNYYGDLNNDDITAFKNDVGYIVDSIVSDLINGSNSRTLNYSYFYYDKNKNIIPSRSGLSFDVFGHVKNMTDKIIQNQSISALSYECGNGAKFDGSLIEGFFRKLNIDSYFIENQGGVGLWLLNNIQANVENLNTNYCKESVKCENGAVCNLNDSKSSYGLSGLKATGYSTSAILSAVVYDTANNYVSISGIKGLQIYNTLVGDGSIAKAPYQGLRAEFRITNSGGVYLSSIYVPVVNQPSYLGFDKYTITFLNNLSASIPNKTQVLFYNRSIINASNHTFDYVGSGIYKLVAAPQLGGINNTKNEIYFDSTDSNPSGIVYASSINQLGDARIGDVFKVNDNTNVVTLSGKIGINTANPYTSLEIGLSGSTDYVSIWSQDEISNQLITSKIGNFQSGSNIFTQKARGTYLNPISVIDNDYLGNISFLGHNGSSYFQAASIQSQVEGTPSLALSSIPGRLILSTTSLNSTLPTERLRINSYGNVGIGTSNPSNVAGYTTLSINNATNGGRINLQKNGIDYGLLYSSGVNLFDIEASGSSTSIKLNTNSLERMRIDSNGQVAIGTSTPITVSSEGRALHVYNNTNTGTVSSNTVVVAESVNRNAYFISYVGSAAGQHGGLTVGDTATKLHYGRIIINNDKSTVFQTGSTVAGAYIETFRIDPIGNIISIGNLYLSGNETVGSNLNVLNSLYLSGNGNIKSNLNVSSNFYLSGNGNIGTNLNVLGTSYLSGNQNIGTNLNVLGTSYLSGNQNIGANLNVLGTSYLSGNQNIGTNLNVLGSLFLSGNETVGTNLNVLSSFYLSGNGNIGTNLNVLSSLYLSGNGNIKSNLNVLGSLFLSGNETVGTNLNVLSSLYLSGNGNIGTNLNVLGTSYLSGNQNIGTNLNVLGSLYLSGNGNIGTNLNVLSSLYLSGNGYISNNLYVLSGLLSANGGSSKDWVSTYTTVTANSASWMSNFTTTSTNSGLWMSNFTTTSANSGLWMSNFTTTSANSASWVSNFTTTSANSGFWMSNFTTTSANSASWVSNFTTISANSASWVSNFTTTSAKSGLWMSNFTTTSANSGLWMSNFTTTSANSGLWMSNFTTTSANSASWGSNFTTTSANSGLWMSNFTTTSANSGLWMSNFTTISANSGVWQSVYSLVSAKSSLWTNGSQGDTLNSISNYTTVSSNSANWQSVYTTYKTNSANYATINFVNSSFLPASGGNLTGSITGTYATFTSSVCAPSLSGTHYGDGTNLTGVIHTQYVPPSAATFSNSVSAPSLSGTHYGDGTNLTGVIHTQYVPPSAATFTSSVSSPALSGTHYGDGTNLTGVIHTQYVPPDNATFNISISSPSLSGTYYGDGSNLTGVIHTQYVPPSAATFTSSVSAPALSGTHYGDGSRLTGVVHIQYAPPSAATFITSVSAPALSGKFFGDGSNLTGITAAARDSTKLPLSGGTITGSLTIQDNLTVASITLGGSATFVNTLITTTSSLSVVNTSPLSGSPALYVGQNGPSDIASFYDIDQNIEVLHIGGVNSLFPNVGIKTSNPNKTLTVSGEISASNNIWTSGKFYGDGSQLTGLPATYTPPANATFTSSVSAPALSGTFYGDGINLTGVIHTQYVPPSDATFISSVSAPALSGTFYGDGSKLTGLPATYTPPSAATFSTSVSSPALSGTHYGDGSNLTGVVHTQYVPPSSATFSTSVSTPLLSAGFLFGDGTNLTGVVHTQYVPPSAATFTSSVSAPALSGTHYGDGTNLTGVVHTQYVPPSAATFTSSVSAPSLSGTFYGDGSNLTGVVHTQYVPPSDATFSTSVSSPALSGTHYGDGTNLTGVIHTQYVPPSDATFISSVSAPSLSGTHYGDGTNLTGVIHTQYVPPSAATFTSSVSAPSLSGTFYGDGSKLTGLPATYTPPDNATFTSSVSAPSLSGTHYGDGSNLTGVINSNTSIVPGSIAITNIVQISQTNYNNIVSPSATTLYIII